MSKSIGLPFRSELVPKVLDGSKTQTRRIPGVHNCRLINYHNSGQDVTGKMRELDWDKIHIGVSGGASQGRGKHVLGVYHPGDDLYYVPVPRHEPGDIAWMREGWAVEQHGGDCLLDYTADPGSPLLKAITYEDGHKYANGKRRPAIHMPRKFSRKEMVLTGVRIELIQYISEEDALAEGVENLFTQEQYDRGRIGPGKPGDFGFKNYMWHGNRGLTSSQIDSWPHQCSNYDNARDSFSSLWEKINASRGWGWELNRPVVVFEWGKRRG